MSFMGHWSKYALVLFYSHLVFNSSHLIPRCLFFLQDAMFVNYAIRLLNIYLHAVCL